MGIIYGKMGLMNQAIEEFSKSLHIDPDNPITILNLAFAYEQLTKEKEQRAKRTELRVKAIQTYEKVLAVDPDNVTARKRIRKLRAEIREQGAEN